MKQKDTYQCVSCNFYDELEAYANLRKKVHIHYLGKGSVLQQAEIVIKDFQTKDKAEFLITDKGMEIRLDKIVKVYE